MTPDRRSQVVINGRFLARRVTGVERYGREILRYIGSRSRLEATARQGLWGHAWEQFILPTRLHGHSVLWSPANTGPLMVHRQALTIHDLSPLEHPEWFRAGFAAWYRLFLPLLARQVKQVFTPSEYVKQKVIKRFGIGHVAITPNGVDRSIFHPDARLARLDAPESYLLFVGTLEPRKNLDLLLRAWTEIKRDFPRIWLVIVGVSGSVFKTVNLPRETERICFVGYVDDETLAGLYAKSLLLVLPSQDEGFGLPALEAMACGTPVIVSNGGALPEVVGEAGRIFRLLCHSPERTPGRCERSEESRREMTKHDRNELVDVLRECLSNSRLRTNLREKGLERAKNFSWQETAEIVWKCLHEI